MKNIKNFIIGFLFIPFFVLLIFITLLLLSQYPKILIGIIFFIACIFFGWINMDNKK